MISENPTLLLITLNINESNTEIKKSRLAEWISFRKQILLYAPYEKSISDSNRQIDFK
jgi:hypothetical protein